MDIHIKHNKKNKVKFTSLKIGSLLWFDFDSHLYIKTGAIWALNLETGDILNTKFVEQYVYQCTDAFIVDENLIEDRNYFRDQYTYYKQELEKYRDFYVNQVNENSKLQHEIAELEAELQIYKDNLEEKNKKE